MTLATLIVTDAIATPSGKTCAGCRDWKPFAAFSRQANGPFGYRSRCRLCLLGANARYVANHAGNSHVFEDRRCQQCGASFRFMTALNRHRPNQGRFCSVKCKADVGRKIVECEQCGLLFRTWRCKTRRFCSLQCAGRINASPVPRGPYFYSRPDWLKLRRQIIERDGFKCQRCRSTSRIVVHHIEPLRVGHDNSPDNLVAVCRPCHGYIHRVATSQHYVPVVEPGGVSSRSRR